MSEIKQAKTVMLKSGGPIMTVENTGDYPGYGIENGALCVWFDGSTPMERVFDIDGLEVCIDE